jgi:hypothetical protein
MYSKFEGIIDCFESGFKNYFPDIKNFALLSDDPQNENHKKLWTFHETLKNSNGNPQRIAFKNDFFCWFYYDLRKDEILQKMQDRIDRMYDYLSHTKDRVVFVRSVLDQNEIEMFDKFRDCINLLFPKLNWKFIYLHDQHDNDNTSESYISNSEQFIFINAPTHPCKPDAAFNLIKSIENEEQPFLGNQKIKIHTSKLAMEKYFTE